MAVVSSCFDVYNLVYITNAILLTFILFFFFYYYIPQILFKSKLKSSPHDLSALGHTRITTIKTTSFKKAILRDL